MFTTWRFGGIVAAISLALASLTGCAELGASSAGPRDEQVAAELSAFYSQQLQWESCDDTFKCATATVPLDWSEPAGETISLALIRHAAPQGKSQGSLFVNPGGPGASGVTFVRDSLDYAVDDRLLNAFDVIGFDPRGVGESTSVQCFDSSEAADEYVYGITPGVRGSAAWRAAAKAEAKSFAADCLAQTGDLLGHVDSISVARDLDVLRAIVGDAKLNYIGYSYGTFIGAMYAQTFPDKVGHLVLDGAVDPSISSEDSLVTQAKGFDMALGNWIRWCFTQDDCPFVGSTAQVKREITSILRELDDYPQIAEDGRLVGADAFATGMFATLYSPDSWRYLTQLFNDYFEGSVETALAIADWYNDRGEDGTYNSNQTEAFTAVGCLDSSSDSSVSAAALSRRLAKEAPVFGPYFDGVDSCASWAFEPVITTAKMTPTGPAPIVVIGTTGDPATPIAWSRSFAAQLQDGRFISYDGEGHTGYNKGSACVDNAVDDYFIDDQAPARTVSC